jgi:type IV pilus assembly protein PilC
MPAFVWEARTRAGEVKNGTMVADTMEAVQQRLRQQSLQPQSVKKQAMQINIKLPSFGGGVTSKDLVLFTRQFSTMIDAGLPLVQCLDILGNQNNNPEFKRVLLDIKSTVETGTTFAEALKKHPKVFDTLFTNLVAAGETGGILDSIMQKLSLYIEKNIKLVKKVKGALTYPLIVLSVSFAVVTVLLMFVIPTFEKMFKDMGGTLPALTQFLVDLSRGLGANAIWIFPSIGITVFGLWRLKNTKKGTEVFDKYILKAPVFGEIVRRVAVARFTSTMGTMLSSGVPILDSLDIVARSAGNTTVEQGILYVRAKISEGKTMAQPLADTKIFPPMVVQMIAVGESTGALDKMLGKIADFYEEEVDDAVNAMTALIEPVMMVFLGGLLGTMMIAMYLPIFTMAGSIKS